MLPSHERIVQLLVKQLKEKLPEEEWRELEQWKALSAANREIAASFNPDEELNESLLDALSKQAVWDRIRAAAFEEAPVMHAGKRRKMPVYWGWAAAVLVLLALGIYQWQQHTPRQQMAAVPPGDVAPAGNKASLTLANGTVIPLDSSRKDVILQGNTAIRQTNGQLQYIPGTGEKSISYNTLTTPRGGQYRLILPDGTRVWLNAASSLRYPAVFNAKEREVELNGEAYFEVAQMAAVPFRVKAGNRTTVDVLGTSFNLSAYPDEPSINTTLLNGKVKVEAPGQPAALLLPGQQAKLNEQGVLQVLTNVDVAQVVAWKDGWFQFHNANLTEVLRELSRWYNVTFIYEGNIAPRAFEGRIQRDLALSKVLNALEKAQVHFRIEGNKVFVLP